jgi:hypothetical protein
MAIISPYFKCKWINFSNQKTWSSQMVEKKTRPKYIYCLQKTHLSFKNILGLGMQLNGKELEQNA